MKSKLVSCFVFSMAMALCLDAAEAQVPDATELFSRHIASAGGREALASVKSATATGTVEEGQTTSEFTFQFKAPGLLLLTTRDASGKTTRQGRDPGARFWGQDAKGIRNLSDTEASELSGLSFAFNPAGLVFLSERLADAVTETDTAEGRKVFAVGRKKAKHMFPRLLFDAETGRLMRVGHARFEEYRPVNGIQVPHMVRQGARAVYRVKSIRFNESLPDAVFERPGGHGGWLAQVSPGFRGGTQQLGTMLSATGKLEIVRRPRPAHSGSDRLRELPKRDPNSGRHGQVSVQGGDLRKLNLVDRLPDLLHADFDTRTLWPTSLPAGFDPSHVVELGKDPGLGVRKLHAQGITGKGIGVATIDFPLLTEHKEYADRLRLYEEIQSVTGMRAHMHGSAVASIAVGKTCGVAPEAELYHISAQNGSMAPGGRMELDFTAIAKAINRLLEVNATLPVDRKIRVISLSMGWTPGDKGYEEVMAAANRAKQERVFVISTALRRTHQLQFDGLGREAVADPNVFESYGPGSWWATLFWSGEMRFKPGKRLCVPMDSRTTASPTGLADYTHYDYSGWSWAVPWVAGLYALACEVKPDLTPELFWAEALRTGRTIRLQHDGEEMDFGTIADPVALISALRPADGQKAEGLARSDR